MMDKVVPSQYLKKNADSLETGIHLQPYGLNEWKIWLGFKISVQFYQFENVLEL